MNKNNNLVIATDLDGTLLDGKSSLSKENLDSIVNLSKKGIEIIVLTGRTFYEIPKELRECEYINYFVYSNGAGRYFWYRVNFLIINVDF